MISHKLGCFLVEISFDASVFVICARWTARVDALLQGMCDIWLIRKCS
jgi:hypothetical protein